MAVLAANDAPVDFALDSTPRKPPLDHHSFHYCFPDRLEVIEFEFEYQRVRHAAVGGGVGAQKLDRAPACSVGWRSSLLRVHLCTTAATLLSIDRES
jgi:hypothetical protein